VNRSPVSSVAVSSSTGSYELAVPSKRDAEGKPVALDLTLRADAAGYQTFPSGIRQALPISTANPVSTDDRLVVQSSLTEVGLIPLPAGSGTATVRGKVALPEQGARGVLVVAETSAGSGSMRGYTAIADIHGDYAIFNVPAGPVQVTGYARDLNYVPAEVTTSDGATTSLDLALSGEAPATLTGKVSLVNAPAGTATSVILVVESTFNENLVRGETPPGLRAPDPGIAPDITGDFTLSGVPAGKYVALAAFENDGLVRDPDTCISGTDILHVTVTPGQQLVLDSAFKITGALDVVTPGAEFAEAVSGTPSFSWVDDSSETGYQVQVFDSFGEEVWNTQIASSSGADPVLSYGGPALQSGMYYQFRVMSLRKNNECQISLTEDLKGVFFIP
jgi:hypothetical protein